MIDFKDVSIEDSVVMTEYFSKVNYRNCDFSFATIFTWSHKYKTSYAIIDGFMVVRFICDDGLPCFMMPIGNGDIANILRLMMNEAEAGNERFRIHAITAQMFSVLDEALPNTFSFTEHRDYFEYLYLAEDLIHLQGKKYQPKRNHINRFKRENPNYSYLPLTNDLFPLCLGLYEKWKVAYLLRNPDEDLQGEEVSVHLAFKYFEELKLKGGALFVGNELVAFTFGEQITEDTFAIHAEKALTHVHGAFTMINNLFAAHEASSFIYINREEDLGIEPLRKAKMSYNPVRLLKRGSVYLA